MNKGVKFKTVRRIANQHYKSMIEGMKNQSKEVPQDVHWAYIRGFMAGKENERERLTAKISSRNGSYAKKSDE